MASQLLIGMRMQLLMSYSNISSGERLQLIGGPFSSTVLQVCKSKFVRKGTSLQRKNIVVLLLYLKYTQLHELLLILCVILCLLLLVANAWYTTLFYDVSHTLKYI